MPQHRNTHYQKEWEKEFPWLESTESDDSSAKCKLCQKTFKVNNGGKSQVKSHSIGKAHKDFESIASLKSGQSILRIGANNNMVVQPSKLNLTSDDEVLRAEIIWALKCCKSNFSFSSNDDLNDIFPLMFPDSEIAKRYQMASSKAKYLIQFGIAPIVLETLKQDIKKTPMTFQFDETTTSQVKKQYDGHIQYESKIYKRIVTRYCGSLFVGHCDAQQLRAHFYEFGKNLDWNVYYLLHLMMDGPNVNKLFERELVEELKQLYDKVILKTSTCSLHPVHTAFKNGLSKIPLDLDKFAQDLHFFFKNSAARREDYNFANLESEIETHFMLRHVSSRWLSLKVALVRIQEQWKHLQEYFLKFLPTTKNFASKIESTARYQSIRTILKDQTSLICISFAIHLADIMEHFLIPMQSGKPKIHILFTKIGDLLFKLMSCFVKDKLLKSTDNIEICIEIEQLFIWIYFWYCRYDARDLGALKVDHSKNLKKIHDVDYGMRSKYLIANAEKNSKLDTLKVSLQSCYIEATSYLQSKLPHDSIFLRDLQCIQPARRSASSSVAAAGRVALSMANVLKITNFLTTKSPEDFADEVKMEFRLYQSEHLEISEEITEDIELYWDAVPTIKCAADQFKFKKLAVLVKACLCISHGNASPERGFSHNKNILDDRFGLHEKTIEALRLVKDAILLYGGVVKFPLTRELFISARNARAGYHQYLADQKEATKRADEQRLNEKQNEQYSNKDERHHILDTQIAEEERKRKAALELIALGNASIEATLSSPKINREEIAKANMLLGNAIENSKTAENRIVELNKDKKKLYDESKNRKSTKTTQKKQK